jgi:hypothetical protein
MPARWAALSSQYGRSCSVTAISRVGGFNYLDLRTERAPFGVSLLARPAVHGRLLGTPDGNLVDALQNNRETQHQHVPE